MMKLLGALMLLALSAPLFAVGSDRAAIETIVHDYILNHPEIIPEALQVLDDRKAAQTIATNRAAIETPFGYATEGNPHGDVTLVEFFDYNCGYCRASVADTTRLLAEDKQLRVVYRELPVLGAESDAAALTSLSIAQCQTGWAAFHRAVYAEGDASQAALFKIMRKLGVSACEARSNQIWRAEISNNLNVAQQLRISGTPSWVIGSKLLSGAVGYDELKAAIAAVRKAKAH